jgi:hypothetical protein
MQQAPSYVNEIGPPAMRKRQEDNIKEPNLLEFRDIKNVLRQNI